MDREGARRQTVFLAVVAAVVFWLGYLARDAVLPLLVALILAYVLAPLVARLEKRGLSRVAAVTILFVSFFGAASLALVLGLPPLLAEGRDLARAAMGEPARTLAEPESKTLESHVGRTPPTRLEAFLQVRDELPGEAAARPGNFERRLKEIRETGGEDAAQEFRGAHARWLVGRHRGRVVAWDDVNGDGKCGAGYAFDAALIVGGALQGRPEGMALAVAVEDAALDAAPRIGEVVLLQRGDLAREALGVLGILLRALAWLVIVPLYTFFFLMRLEDVWNAFVSNLPGAYRDRVVRVLGAIHRMLIGFFRGRLLTMFFKGIMIAVGLGLVGAPYWPVFGAAAGLLTIIPAVGPLAAGAPAAILAYTEGGPVTAGLAVGVLLAAEIVEGYVLIPKLVGKEVGLHPVAVITSILVGASLLGTFGVVIAIPLAASAKIVWEEFVVPSLKAKAAEPPPPGTPAPPA